MHLGLHKVIFKEEENIFHVAVRCYLFPTRVLYSTIHAAEAYIDMFPAYYIFNCLLIILQFLNVMWTVLILRVSRKFVLQTFRLITISTFSL